MVARDRFPIAELARRSEVPPATIHHYLRAGLLPPPQRVATNRFLYDERHVQALRLIRILRERRRLSLRAIRRVLPDLVALEGSEAFRPEMWDRAIDLRTGRERRRMPGARLLDAAIDAFGRRGYGDANVDEICRAAKIAKGSFYRHFRSKEELFFAAAEAASAQVLDGVRRRGQDMGSGIEDLARSTADLMEPRLALFLDLFAGASQGRPGYVTAARRVFGDLADGLGMLAGVPDRPGSGRAVLERALAVLLGRVLAPSPHVRLAARPR